MSNEQSTTGQGQNLNPFWKCGECGHTMQAPTPPKTCPSCKRACEFRDVSCYTPDCGGPGNIDPKLL